MHSFASADTFSQPLQALMADLRRQPEARGFLASEIAQNPATLNYLKWEREVPPALTERRVALLSSYTVETIRPFLAVEAYLSGWRANPTFLQYSRWQTTLLYPAPELQDHDLAVLLLDDVALAEQVGVTAAEAAITITSMLDGFRSRSSLPLFVGLVPARPDQHAFGFGLVERMQALNTVQAVNAALATFCERDRASHLLNVPGALAAVGPNWHQAEAFASNKSYVSHKGLPALAREIARAIGSMLVPRSKVLVTDLDDTLWGGILGEEGPQGIATGESGAGSHFRKYQQFLKQLRASGILLAIASKNNESDVREAFQERQKDIALEWDDFSAARVCWNDKSASLREMSDELNLGLDSFVFVDDSPVECERIRQALPMVTTIVAPPRATGLVEKILASRAFDTLAISDEDTRRAEQYRVEWKRKAVAVDNSDLLGFLKSLQLRVIIQPFSGTNSNRVHQLLLKTNQFHLTLERPSLSALIGRLQNGNELYALSLVDRFGDYGIIAVVEFEARSNALLICNLAISCRALGRQIEESILALAEDRAMSRKIALIEAKFFVGPRNQMIPDVLRRLGFNQVATSKESINYEYPIKVEAPHWPDMVDIKFEGGKSDDT